MIVDPTTTHQTIDGFGMVPAFCGIMSDAYADLWWGPEGIALSIVRCGNGPQGGGPTLPGWPYPYSIDEAQISNTLLALDRGVTHVHQGGVYIPTDDQVTYPRREDEYGTRWEFDEAAFQPAINNRFQPSYTYLRDRIAAHGVPGAAIKSVGNVGEIDNFGTFTPASALVWNRNYFGPAARSLAPGVAICSPGVLNQNNLAAYTDPQLADVVNAPLFDVVMHHGYFSDAAAITRYAPAFSAGKKIYIQEDSDTQAPRGDLSMARGLYWGRKWHAWLSQADVSAYIWFWPWRPPYFGTEEADGLWGPEPTNTIGKQFWVLGNFSKFIRPGYVRINATGAPAGVYASAYRGPDGKTVIVAVNENAAATPLDVSCAGLAPSVSPWITDATRDLAQQSVAVVSGSSFTYSLPAQSVTTFVSGALSAVADPVVGGATTIRISRRPGTTVTVT